jgi:hypothetical protein
MPGPKGSPRPALAVSLLIANPGLTIEEAMWRAKYNRKAAQCKQQQIEQQQISKKKSHILAVSGKENIPAAVQFFQKNTTGASAATSTLTESNMSSRKGAMKKVSAAEVPPLRSNVLGIIIKE